MQKVVHHRVNKEICTVYIVFPLFCPTPVLTVKLRFYDARFYSFFYEFMPFLHGPCQTPITVTLDFNGFYASATLCFP
jgi:hypothetical protein